MNINATLIGQLIAFTVFVWFCMKFVWPPLLEAIEKRQKEIADGLAKSEKGKKELELAEEAAKKKLKDAKAQAEEIISQANKRASEIEEKAVQEGETKRNQIVLQGEADVEAERSRAKEELRKQVAVLAVAGAEKILAREIDASAQSDIVEKLVAEL